MINLSSTTFLAVKPSNKVVSLVFFNAFGNIDTDGKIIIRQDIGNNTNKIPIRIKQISKVSFYVRRNYSQNFICLLLSMICFFEYLHTEKFLMEHLIFGLIFMIAMGLTVKINVKEYVFLVVSFNLFFSEIKVKKYLKDDAEEMVKYINQACKLKSV